MGRVLSRRRTRVKMSLMRTQIMRMKTRRTSQKMALQRTIPMAEVAAAVPTTTATAVLIAAPATTVATAVVLIATTVAVPMLAVTVVQVPETMGTAVIPVWAATAVACGDGGGSDSYCNTNSDGSGSSNDTIGHSSCHGDYSCLRRVTLFGFHTKGFSHSLTKSPTSLGSVDWANVESDDESLATTVESVTDSSDSGELVISAAIDTPSAEMNQVALLKRELCMANHKCKWSQMCLDRSEERRKTLEREKAGLLRFHEASLAILHAKIKCLQEEGCKKQQQRVLAEVDRSRETDRQMKDRPTRDGRNGGRPTSHVTASLQKNSGGNLTPVHELHPYTRRYNESDQQRSRRGGLLAVRDRPAAMRDFLEGDTLNESDHAFRVSDGFSDGKMPGQVGIERPPSPLSVLQVPEDHGVQTSSRVGDDHEEGTHGVGDVQADEDVHSVGDIQSAEDVFPVGGVHSSDIADAVGDDALDDGAPPSSASVSSRHVELASSPIDANAAREMILLTVWKLLLPHLLCLPRDSRGRLHQLHSMLVLSRRRKGRRRASRRTAASSTAARRALRRSLLRHRRNLLDTLPMVLIRVGLARTRRRRSQWCRVQATAVVRRSL